MKHHSDGWPELAFRYYVLFLVKQATLNIGGIRRSFAHETAGTATAARLEAKASGITFGSMSWSMFAQTLPKALDRRSAAESESAQILTTLIGAFLADLKLRHLLGEKAV